MNKKVIAVAAFVLPAGLADAHPFATTLVGPEGDVIDVRCRLGDDSKLFCDFVHVSLKHEAVEADFYSRIQELTEFFTADDASMAEFCQFFLPFESYFSGEQGMPLPDDVQGIEDRDAFQRAMTDDWDYFQRFFLSGADLCQDPSDESIQNFVSAGLERDLETCKVRVTRYSHQFVELSERTWVIDDLPKGPCGEMSTSRFTSPYADGGVWEYTSENIVVMGDNMLETGEICSTRVEAPALYSWRNAPIRIECMFLK